MGNFCDVALLKIAKLPFREGFVLWGPNPFSNETVTNSLV